MRQRRRRHPFKDFSIHAAGGSKVPIFIFTLLNVMAWTAYGQDSPQTLKQLLQTARQNAPQTPRWQASVAKTQAEVKAIDSAFDSTLFASASGSRDRSESATSQASFGDERQQTQISWGVRKFFPSGTSAELRFARERQEVDFPSQTGQQVAGAPTIPQQEPVNPAYTNQVSLQLNQALWRNFGARQVDLQRQIASSRSVDATFNQRIDQQIVQGQTENLFWTLLRFEEQMIVTRLLVQKSIRYQELMKRRTRFGRADAVDVAQAQAQLVSQEGRLLELQIGTDDTRRQLEFRVNPKSPPAKLRVAGRLHTAVLDLPARNRQEAITQARTQRFDLALVAASRAPILQEKKLARENRKPQLDLFAAWTANGLDQKDSESLREAGEGKKDTVSIGLNFEMNLGNAESRSRTEAAVASLKELDQRAEIIQREMERDIHLAFLALEASFKQKAQADKTIATLERQLAAERRKIRQARSDEIIAIRYEMDVLAAKYDRISALYNARLAEARLRLAMHAYPQGH